MTRHIVFRILAGLVLLAAMAGLGFFAYQAGIAHGVAANIQVSSAETTGSTYLYRGMPYGHFMGFPGFGFFRLLIPLFLLFLAFGAIRRLIWGPRWGMQHIGHGPMGHSPWGAGVPPMFAELHRRAHAPQAEEQPADKKSQQ